jgi:hypothetical protein
MTFTTMRYLIIRIAAASALLLASPAAHAQETMTATVAGRVVTYDRAVEADTDDDGTNDRTTYYMGASMVMTAYDEDQDGRHELWFFYDEEERVNAEAADEDGDGSADAIVPIGPDEQVMEAAPAPEDDAGVSLMLPLIVAAIIVIGIMAALRRHKKKE